MEKDAHVCLRIEGSDMGELWRRLDSPSGDWIRAPADRWARTEGWPQPKALRRGSGEHSEATLYLDLDGAREVVRSVDASTPSGGVGGRAVRAELEADLRRALPPLTDGLEVEVHPEGPASELWDAPDAVAEQLWRVQTILPYRTKAAPEHEEQVRALARVAECEGWALEDPAGRLMDLGFVPDAAVRLARVFRGSV